MRRASELPGRGKLIVLAHGWPFPTKELHFVGELKQISGQADCKRERRSFDDFDVDDVSSQPQRPQITSDQCHVGNSTRSFGPFFG